jgi:type I restriction enzyme M protein
MTIIDQAIKKKLISFNDDKSRVTYLSDGSSYSYKNPEEKVRLNTYIKLIKDYGYSRKQIRLEVPITMGSETKRADIVVYNDDACTKPHIVVECKRPEVSEMEFDQAINQGFSYAQALAGTVKYVWTTSSIKNEYLLVDKEKQERITASDIPQKGVEKLATFKYAKGGGEKDGQKLFDLVTVSEDDLTTRFKQAHQALWGGGELNPSEAFDELDKLIFCKIWDERKPRKKGVAYDFQIITAENDAQTNKNLLERINRLYEEGRKKDPEVFKDGVRLNAVKCRTVVTYLESINLSKTDLDSKGRAFETFMGSFFRGDFGQYFTPRAIVNFIVSVLPMDHESRVLDTSCGSGGFLLHALDKVRKQADDYYDDRDSKDHFNHWHDFAEKRLFGIEINEQIARTAKMNMIIHDDGHTNVISCDGLLPLAPEKEKAGDSDEVIAQKLREGKDTIQGKTNNQGFKENSFDFIITNPPFGSSVKQLEKAYLHQYRLGNKNVDWLNPKSKASGRPNQSTEVLFIEQDYKFLRENGYLAIVIPDGVLTNSSLQYVRDQIEEDFRLVAVVSLPQTAFAANGAGVKSSVMILKKYTEEKSKEIRGLKHYFQESAKDKNNFNGMLPHFNKMKAEAIKSFEGYEKPIGLSLTEIRKRDDYKDWKQGVTDKWNALIDDLKESTLDTFIDSWKNAISDEVDGIDYPIFMAIAEDIGYDATGKPTGNNELEVIGKELTRFIEAIENGEA